MRDTWTFWQQLRSNQRKHLWIPYRNPNWWNHDFDVQAACGFILDSTEPPYPAQRAEKCGHCLKIEKKMLNTEMWSLRRR